MVYVKFKDGSEDEVDVINQRVNAFGEDNVGDAVWTWSFVRFEEADCTFDTAAREEFDTWEWRGVDGFGWDRGGEGRWREEGLG